MTFSLLQGGCIIRAGFLDDIKQAYERNKELENLILDDWFAERLAERQNSWRETIKLAITSGKNTACHLFAVIGAELTVMQLSSISVCC